jgi:hypothetical protein
MGVAVRGRWPLMLRTGWVVVRRITWGVAVGGVVTLPGKLPTTHPDLEGTRMAKFMLIKIGLMAEITDADVLRDAALKHFDTADITSDDHPDTADWHASEVGQEERRQITTEDKAALEHLFEHAKAKELLGGLLDGVPGAKTAGMSSTVVELEGTALREAREAWGKHVGIPWLADALESQD